VKFGPVPLQEAEGAIAAHSLRHGSGVIRKGTALNSAHISDLRAAGLTEVVVARLDPDDVHEDAAAHRIAELLCGRNIRLDAAGTGRCNLYAEQAGIFLVDRAAIDALNRLDPGITVATLPPYQQVETGRMVATVKIIPFAIPERAIRGASAYASAPLLIADGMETAQSGACGDDPGRPETLGDGQDAAGPRGALAAGRREHCWRNSRCS
jgi:molybdenum cofactor cytidylyltransferase